MIVDVHLPREYITTTQCELPEIRSQVCNLSVIEVRLESNWNPSPFGSSYYRVLLLLLFEITAFLNWLEQSPLEIIVNIILKPSIRLFFCAR